MPWTEIKPGDLDAWNKRLLQAAAPLFQLPFWNEPLRLTRLSPRYLIYDKNGTPVAYVCVLMLTAMGFRAGVIRRGPVSIDASAAVSDQALEELGEWAKRNRFAFLRFTHHDSNFLNRVEQLKGIRRFDALPFYSDLSEELIVELVDDASVMLSRFQAVARRNINQALRAGYEIEVADSPEEFRRVWPLFEQLAQRKGFQYRPLASYLDLINRARSNGCVRIHTASLNGKIIEAILVIRDKVTALYMSGALDVDALAQNSTASPSCLVHWNAMRDARSAGVQYYNLGSRSGTVYSFKRKFHPREHKNPEPATLVLNPFAFALWDRVAIPFVRSVWPRIRRLLFR